MTTVRVAVCVVAGAIVSASSFAASGLSVRETAKVAMSEKDAWAKFGEFCSIKDWHPAVADCKESRDGDDILRTLTLKGGGTIKEKLTGFGVAGYTYAIVESALPVKDYFASFSLKSDNDDPGHSVVVWSSNFTADGKPDGQARGIIEGILKDGLAAIAAKASQK